MKRAFWITACVVSSSALAQSNQAIEEQLRAIRYPALARTARVQGEVRAEITAGDVKILSGSPLLREPVSQAAKMLVPSDGLTTELLFHFELLTPSVKTIEEREPKGDTFDRILLRLFRLPTYRTSERRVCAPSTEPPFRRINLAQRPIEIWFRDPEPCFQPIYDGLVARAKR